MKSSMNRTSPIAIACLAVSLVLISGCSSALIGGSHDDEGDHHDSVAGRPGLAANVDRTVEVDMADSMRFTPASIEVKAGETIRFDVKNSGKIVHEFVIGSKDEITDHHKLMVKFPGMEHDEQNSVSLETDESGEVVWQFTNSGNFDFACLQPGHYEAGMKGSFVVSE